MGNLVNCICFKTSYVSFNKVGHQKNWLLDISCSFLDQDSVVVLLTCYFYPRCPGTVANSGEQGTLAAEWAKETATWKLLWTRQMSEEPKKCLKLSRFFFKVSHLFLYPCSNFLLFRKETWLVTSGQSMRSGWRVWIKLWFFILVLLTWDFLTSFPCISLDVRFKGNWENWSTASFLLVNASQFYFHSTDTTCKQVISDQQITAPATQTKPAPWSTFWGNCSVFFFNCQ